jgi:hypothetical protein
MLSSGLGLGLFGKKPDKSKLSTPTAVKAVAFTPKSIIKGLMGFFSSTPPIVEGQKLADELESVITDKKQEIQEELQAKAETESAMGDETVRSSKTSKAKGKRKGKGTEKGKAGEADIVTKLAKNNQTSKAKDKIKAKIAEIAESELKQEYDEYSVRKMLEDPFPITGKAEETIDETKSNMHEGVTGEELKLPGDLDLPVTETPTLNAVSTMLELVLFENAKCEREIDTLLPDIFAECNRHVTAKLAEARKRLVAEGVTTDRFRATCVDEVRLECQAMLQHCFPPATLSASAALLSSGFKIPHEFTDAVTREITSSWLCELNLPNPTTGRAKPGILDSSNEIFFKRVTASIAGLRANTLFCSPEWRMYKERETEREKRDKRSHYVAYNGGPPPPPPLNFPRSGPPPGNDPEPFYYHVNIEPYRYVVGPILDFENNLEGRTFVYIKCYDDNSYTTGFYFWVYLSQSEGLFRVFFKLKANSIIEKGYDYTQATLVDFRLQRILCSYYKKHYNRGKRNPIYVDNYDRFYYFFKEMPYLQSESFLGQFPGGVVPCNYTAIPPPPPGPGCSYIGITPRGYVGHYYVITSAFNNIIRNGFNMSDPPPYRPPEMPPFSNFYRDAYYNSKSYPLIYCFTTCVMEVECSSFDLFLNTDNYKQTFWCQGFENFTRIMTPAAPANIPPILSPVLYVIIGSMLQNPDFSLSKFRNQILNHDPLKQYPSLDARMDFYRRSHLSLGTLGTKDITKIFNAPNEPTIYLPTNDPYPRWSAVRAFEGFRNTCDDVFNEYERKIMSNDVDEMANQKSIVEDKVTEVVEKCRNILFSFSDFDTTLENMLVDGAFDTSIGNIANALLDRADTTPHETAIKTMIFNMISGFIGGAIAYIRLRGNYDVNPDPRAVQEIFDAIIVGLPDDQENVPDINDDAVFEHDRNLLSAVRTGIMHTHFPDPLQFVLDIIYIRMNRKVLFKYTQQNNQRINGIFQDLVTKCPLPHDLRLVGSPQEQQSQKNEYIAEFKQKFKEECYKLFSADIANVFLACGEETDVSFSRVSHGSAQRVERIAGRGGNIPNAIMESEIYAKASGIFRSRIACYYQVYDSSNQKYNIFRDHLTDYAILCLKKNWLSGMMDNSYEALTSIFNDSNCRNVYYFANNGNFIPLAPIQINGENVFECLNPSNLPAGQLPPYELVSVFDEKSVRSAQISVKVVTIAHIYRLDYEYATTLPQPPVFGPGPVKRMSLFIQVSSTVVYSTQNNTILYSYDMQRTPIACIPDLPDPVVGGAIPNDVFQLLQACVNSPYTICGTYKRVSSWGGFFAGKMMDYLFNDYYQAPSLFKLFINQLQVSPQYCTTALIYCNDIPPYSVLKIPQTYTFAACFMNYFRDNNVPMSEYWIERCLIRHSSQIHEISRLVTSDFMIDIDKDDVGSISSYLSNTSSKLSASCISSTTNSESSRQFCAFDAQDNQEIKQSLCYFLTAADLQESQCSALDPLVLSQNLDGDDDDGGDDDDSSGDEGQPPSQPLTTIDEVQISDLPPAPLQAQVQARPRPPLKAKRPSRTIDKPIAVVGNMGSNSSSSSSLEPITPRSGAVDMFKEANPIIPPLPKPAKRSTRQPIKTPTARQTRGPKVRIHGGMNGGKIYRSSTCKNKGKRYKTFRKKRNAKANGKSANKHPNKQTRRNRCGRN